MDTEHSISSRSLLKAAPAAEVIAALPVAVAAADNWFEAREREIAEANKIFDDPDHTDEMGLDASERIYELEMEIARRRPKTMKEAAVQARMIAEHALDEHSVFAYDGPEGVGMKSLLSYLEGSS